MIYAIDTNITIRLLRYDDVVCTRRDEVLKLGCRLIIPVFVDYEMWRGFYYRSAPTKEALYCSLCERYPIIEMTAEVWKQAAMLYADLRRGGRTIEDADILIAALCLVNGYTLVTNNTRHFMGIEDLQLVDWTI